MPIFTDVNNVGEGSVANRILGFAIAVITAAVCSVFFGASAASADAQELCPAVQIDDCVGNGSLALFASSSPMIVATSELASLVNDPKTGRDDTETTDIDAVISRTFAPETAIDSFAPAIPDFSETAGDDDDSDTKPSIDYDFSDYQPGYAPGDGVPATEDDGTSDGFEPGDIEPQPVVSSVPSAIPIDLPFRDEPITNSFPTDDTEADDEQYSAGDTFLDQQPIRELPLSDVQEIYDAFWSPALSGLRSRQDTSDDVPVDTVEPAQVPKLTAGRTVLVIDALAEVGAFRRDDDPQTTSTIRAIRDLIPSDGLTADGYRAEIRRFSFELGPALDTLEAEGIEVSPALAKMAESLSPDLLDALDGGETSIVDPQPWLNGLADLVVRDGAAPIRPALRTADRPAVMAVVAAVAGVDIDRVASGERTDDQIDGTGSELGISTDSGGGWLASTFIATAVALVAALGVVRQRTAPAPGPAADVPPPKLSITDLLDASRRMTASLDVEEIGTTVMAETRRLVAAEGCIIALREGKMLSALHHEPAELFEPAVLSDPEAAESCLRRVVETGQATVMVAADEPVLVEVPMALIAVPIVVDGQVAGAMLIVRVSARPFDRDDVEALEMLAPMVGTALRSAATHGSATALAETEPLTGLKNRRRLEQDLASLDEEPTVSYIMIDVDHFKNFNDENGHAAGDEALCKVARVLEASVRPGDLVYRYGGEEFCMLLPNVSREGALIVAERVRQAVEEAEIPGGESQPAGCVTVSVGVACDGPAEALVERADAALYRAKRSGRNKVEVAETV